MIVFKRRLFDLRTHATPDCDGSKYICLDVPILYLIIRSGVREIIRGCSGSDLIRNDVTQLTLMLGLFQSRYIIHLDVHIYHGDLEGSKLQPWVPSVRGKDS